MVLTVPSSTADLSVWNYTCDNIYVRTNTLSLTYLCKGLRATGTGCCCSWLGLRSPDPILGFTERKRRVEGEIPNYPLLSPNTKVRERGCHPPRAGLPLLRLFSRHAALCMLLFPAKADLQAGFSHQERLTACRITSGERFPNTQNKSKIDFPGVQEVETFAHVIQSIKMQMWGGKKRERNESKEFPDRRTRFCDR